MCVSMGARVKPGHAVDNFLIRTRDRVICYLGASLSSLLCFLLTRRTGRDYSIDIDCNDTSPRNSILLAQCSRCA